MMDSMVGSTIDPGNGKCDSVMNIDSPHRNDNERNEMHSGVKREEEDENLVASALQVTIKRVKRESRERGRVDE